MPNHAEEYRSHRWRVTLRAIPWPPVVALAVSVTVLFLHTQRFPRFFFDDAFISLRYADRLRSGHGFSWTDGEHVEGFTNFLWVVLIAVIGLVRDDLIVPARVLGFVATSLGLAALIWTYRSRTWAGAITSLFPGLAVAVLGPVAAWSVGGLEAPLILAGLGFALVFAYDLLERRTPSRGPAVGLGIALAVLAVTRPDGAMFTAVFWVSMLIARRFSRAAWLDGLVFGSLSSACFLALSVFRRAYFGSWVPNTASSKLVFSSDGWSRGWSYILRDFQLWVPFVALAMVSVVLAGRIRETRRRVAVVLPALAAWLVYVAAIGGDFMPQRRHLVPALFLVVALAAEAVFRMTHLHPRAARAAWAVGLVTCGLVAAAQRNDWAVADANNADWYWNAEFIGQFFRAAFGDKDPLLAVDAAGALPYYSRLRTLDMLGLNDRHIASHPPRHRGGQVGHELGDGQYVLGRKPDLVVFHLPHGQETPKWRSGREMAETLAFRTYYQRLYYVTPVAAIRGVAYIRREDGVLAPTWSEQRLRIPAYLFAGRSDARATLDAHGEVVVRLGPDGRARLSNVELRRGRCTASVGGSEHLILGVERDGKRWTARPGQVVEFEIDAATRADLEVVAPAVSAVLRHVLINCVRHR